MMENGLLYGLITIIAIPLILLYFYLEWEYDYWKKRKERKKRRKSKKVNLKGFKAYEKAMRLQEKYDNMVN